MARSKSTEVRVAVLESEHQNIMEKFEELIKRFDSFEEKLDKALEKKADKWVEKLIIWLGIFIGTSLLSYLGYLIVKVIEL